jgi:uncharacterized protein YndB with AHSA1/START domain
MTQDTDHAVRLSRTFEASRETLWKAWTDPAEFGAWYGPDGAAVEVLEFDLRPGGRRVVAMHVKTPNGPMTMTFAGEFREVEEPTRLVYTEAHADENGSPSGPDTVVEVDLHDDGGRTTLELTHHGIPAGSPGEAGWVMALSHLEERLEVG